MSLVPQKGAMEPPVAVAAAQPSARGVSLGLMLSIAAILLLFGAFLWFVWYAGFFDFTGSDASANVTAAAVALVGGFLAALLSLFGVLLKHSIDVRTERRLELEAQRNYALSLDAEKRAANEAEWNRVRERDAAERLKLEAGIRAVQLFSTSDGKPAPKIQRDGALFTLSNLGFHTLTVVLVGHLFRTADMDAETAGWLLDRAIMEGDLTVKMEAMMTTHDLAEKWISPHAVCFPMSVIEHAETMPPVVRDWAATALGRIVVARPAWEWRKQGGNFAGILYNLYRLWTVETDARVRDETGAILHATLAAVPDWEKLHVPGGAVDIESIRAATRSAKPQSRTTQALVETLQEWKARSEP